MSEPQRLGDILTGPMSRVDGCPRDGCDNTEPPRAAIPIDGGWRASYACTDCGHAWVADWPDSPVTQGESGAKCDRLAATTKTAPAVRQHRDSGASPTGLESTG